MPRRLIEWILDDLNIDAAISAVKRNRGAPGIDGMTVDELDEYFRVHRSEIKLTILNKEYKPQPVKRVYIPKPNGEKRPLGIPTVVDRVVQEAVAQILIKGYERYFSEYSYGFRPGRNCHQAVQKSLEYMNAGYEWVVDIDVEKYFDTVNHDKLISILRERINDDTTLHLIRSFLKAGVMEDGLASPTEAGVPQGGPLSPVLSNIYLDKLDRELERRGLRFARYADDCNVFLGSEMAANRVMKSISGWLERKLRLKVNMTKSKVVRPTRSQFLGFGYWKSPQGWKPKPDKARMKRLYDKTRQILCRRRAVAIPLGVTITRLNQLMRGWINYFSLGSMKGFMKKFGEWMRHKVRVVILKQWKNLRTIFENLLKTNRITKKGLSEEDIYIAAYSNKGWYKKATHNVVNWLLSPELLSQPTSKRPGLVDPLQYYLARCI